MYTNALQDAENTKGYVELATSQLSRCIEHIMGQEPETEFVISIENVSKEFGKLGIEKLIR